MQGLKQGRMPARPRPSTARSVIIQSYQQVSSVSDIFKDVLLQPQKEDMGETSKFAQFMNVTLVATNEMQNVRLAECIKSLDKPVETLKNVITRAIKDLSLRGDLNSNVLNLTERSNSCAISASSPGSLLLTKPWHVLHSRIGDEAMLNLVSKYSLFIKDGNNYIQVTGRPITQVIKKPVKENRMRKRKLISSSEPDPLLEKQLRRKRCRKAPKVDHPVGACCSDIGFHHHVVIQHKEMYYGRDLREKFHDRHTMSKANVSPADLWHEILCTNVLVSGSAADPKTLPNESVPSLLDDLIKNHQKQYHNPRKISRGIFKQERVISTKGQRHQSWQFIINNYCPFTKDESPSIENLVNSSSIHGKVFLFIRRILKQVIPFKMWGSLHNQTVFFKNIKRVITMKHYQKLFLGDVMNNVKVSHMKWIPDQLCLPMKECLGAKMLMWTMYYTFAVMKSYFYVTESEIKASKKKAVFYRKFVWKRIRLLATKDQLERGNLQDISKEVVHRVIQNKKTLGICTMRFIPKPDTTRLLLNLSKKSHGERLTINQQVKPLLLVLKHIVRKKPSLLGYTAKDFKQKFRHFKTKKWKRDRPLYFVKCDIKKCFDSIRLKKLLNIVESILTEFSEENFYTRKMSAVKIKNNRRISRYLQAVQSTMDLSTFSTFVKQQNLNNSVIVDLVSGSHRTGQSFMNLARLHLLLNIISDGSNYYVMRRGISQGAVTSTMLANLYCGDMENRMMHAEHDELLARWVDDYIFISPHRDRAKTFLELLEKGIPDYNLYINHGKTLTNINPDGKTDISNVKWCGFEIDFVNLSCH